MTEDWSTECTMARPSYPLKRSSQGPSVRNRLVLHHLRFHPELTSQQLHSLIQLLMTLQSQCLGCCTVIAEVKSTQKRNPFSKPTGNEKNSAVCSQHCSFEHHSTVNDSSISQGILFVLCLGKQRSISAIRKQNQYLRAQELLPL